MEERKGAEVDWDRVRAAVQQCARDRSLALEADEPTDAELTVRLSCTTAPLDLDLLGDLDAVVRAVGAEPTRWSCHLRSGAATLAAVLVAAGTTSAVPVIPPAKVRDTPMEYGGELERELRAAASVVRARPYLYNVHSKCAVKYLLVSIARERQGGELGGSDVTILDHVEFTTVAVQGVAMMTQAAVVRILSRVPSETRRRCGLCVWLSPVGQAVHFRVRNTLQDT